MGKLTVLAISEIRENPVALRAVNRQDEKYEGLVDSIKQKGFLGAITVRPKIDAETSKEYFELIDGLHRFSAAKDAGLDSINVDIVDLDDGQTLEAQIMTNIHKVETRPVEFSQQLRRILAMNPMMVESELAAKLGKSTQWIKERLGLTKIVSEVIQQLVNDGKIGLANAYAMAKLPPEEMEAFVERAMTLAPEEFVPAVNARAKEIRDAKRQGKEASEAEFIPTAFAQKLKDVKTEADDGEIGKILVEGLNSAEEGFAMAIKWMLHLDPKSAEAQKAKHDERKAEAAEKKKKRDAERAEKKIAAAKKATAEAEEAAKKLAENG